MRFVLCVLALLYVLSPYDFFPDFFVGWGWLDDLAVLGVLYWGFQVYRKRQSAYRSNRSDFQSDSFKEGDARSTSPPREGEITKDPYAVLGIPKGASSEQIKQAYRRLAAQYHPDKVSHLGQEFRELAERRFREIQRAYEELKKGVSAG